MRSKIFLLQCSFSEVLLVLVLFSNQALGAGGPEECSKLESNLKWRTSSTPGTTSVYSVVKLQFIGNI